MATAGNQRGAVDDEAARKVRIRAAFDMFDKEKKGCVIQECVLSVCSRQEHLRLGAHAQAVSGISLCMYVTGR